MKLAMLGVVGALVGAAVGLTLVQGGSTDNIKETLQLYLITESLGAAMGCFVGTALGFEADDGGFGFWHSTAAKIVVVFVAATSIGLGFLTAP